MEETKKLYRSCKDRMLGGVAGGLAEYLNVDSTFIRLIFILLLFSGVGIVIYILAWVIVPEDPSCKSGKTAADEIKEKAEQVAQEIKKNVGKEQKKKNDENTQETIKIFLGLIILALGVILIAQNLIGINIWNYFWPLLLVVLGLFIIAKK